jgi:hypothetical protein
LCDIFHENPWVQYDHCIESMKYYKIIKDDEKASKMGILLNQIKQKLPIHPVPIEIMSKIEYDNYLRDVKKKVSDFFISYPNDICSILGKNSWFVPNLSEINLMKDVYLQDSITLKIFPGIKVVDQNRNISDDIGDERLGQSSLWKMYGIYIQIWSYLHIQEYIHEAIKSNLLSLSNVLNYLHNHTWVGTFEIETETDSEVRSWISAINPGLDEFFKNHYLILRGHEPNFILMIDSLTLKFEGLFRQYCLKNNINITQINLEGRTPPMVELDLNKLLYDSQIKEVIDHENLAFFRFLFIEKQGYNLRNDVAHGLLHERLYSEYLANLLFTAIIRLASEELRK